MRPSIDAEKDYYAILELSAAATTEEIKRAYRRLARRYHPDSGNGDVAAFREVQAAYEVLRDETLRQAYDRQRAARGLTPDAPVTLNILSSRTELPTLATPQMVYLLVNIEPALDLPKTRQPLNLALVIDRSTSMRGRRIENVKLAAHDLVDALEPADRLALVGFSDRAEVLAPSTLARNKLALHSAISRLMSSGGTEIYQGLLAGLQEIRRFVSPESVNHLILLTDGRTYGDEEPALNEARCISAENIGLSALGIGEDWNDLFLDTLARYGGGISEYISSPSQIQHLLRRQIQGLNAAVLRKAKLWAKPATGVRVQSVFRVAPFMETLGVSAGEPIVLGDLTEDVSSVLLELLVEQSTAGERRLLRLDLEVAPRISEGALHVWQDVTVTCVNGRPQEQQVPMRLLSLLSRLSIYRLQERAWQVLEAGDARQATSLLESTATRLFDMGYRELAQAALLEARKVSQCGVPSLKGRKQLRYGTRSLSIAPK